MALSIVHFELPAQDTQRARDFYQAVFEWKFKAFEGPMEYHMTDGIEPVGAVYPQQSGETGPIVYFDTDDINASIVKIREAGGQADDRQPIPGVGWFSRCKDTEGNAFSLYQSDRSVPAPGEH